MSEEWKSELFNRLWRLPGQLLLALVNGTSILVIVAAVLAVIACSRVLAGCSERRIHHDGFCSIPG